MEAAQATVDAGAEGAKSVFWLNSPPPSLGKRGLSPRALALQAPRRCSRPKLRVHFSDEPIILGYADPDVDRRSVEVDLSRSPYALFHKDFYFKTHPQEYSPKSSRAREGAHAPNWTSSDEEDLATEGELSSSEDDDCGARGGGSSGAGAGGGGGGAMHRRTPSAELRRRAAAARPDFSGVWKRARVEGFIELLAFSGVPHKAALSAAQRRAVHIIDHDEEYFRLIVKNGLTKVDGHYIIGDEPRIEKSGGRDYEVVLDWASGTANGKAQSLVLTSVAVGGGGSSSSSSGSSGGGQAAAAPLEMIAVRTLEDGGATLVLQQIVRRPATGEEARARHIFKRLTEPRAAAAAAAPQQRSAASTAAAATARGGLVVRRVQLDDDGYDGDDCEAAAAQLAERAAAAVAARGPRAAERGRQHSAW